MRIKKRNEGEEIEEEADGASWDIKRIGVAFLVLIFLFMLTLIFLPQISDLFVQKTSRVLGVEQQTDDAKISPPSDEEIVRILQNSKEEISKLTVDNVTSSGSAIQSIISNLQQLQKGNVNAKDAICDYFCKAK